MKYALLRKLNREINSEENLPEPKELELAGITGAAKAYKKAQMIPNGVIYVASDPEGDGVILAATEINSEEYILGTDVPITYSEAIRRGYNFYLKKEEETWYKLSQSICLEEDWT